MSPKQELRNPALLYFLAYSAPLDVWMPLCVPTGLLRYSRYSVKNIVLQCTSILRDAVFKDCQHDTHSFKIWEIKTTVLRDDYQADGFPFFTVSCCAAERCVVCCGLSWCLGSVLSWRTYQGRHRDGQRYSSNEICRHRLHSGTEQLVVALLSTTQERERDGGVWGGARWDTELCVCVCVCAHVCLSNFTLMNKALRHAGVPHSSGFKTEEQTATDFPVRWTGAEQNTNVNRSQRGGEIEEAGLWRERGREEERASTLWEIKTQGGALKTGGMRNP